MTSDYIIHICHQQELVTVLKTIHFNYENLSIDATKDSSQRYDPFSNSKTEHFQSGHKYHVTNTNPQLSGEDTSVVVAQLRSSHWRGLRNDATNQWWVGFIYIYNPFTDLLETKKFCKFLATLNLL